LIAELNDLDIMSCDLQNAYLIEKESKKWYNTHLCVMFP